MTLCNAALATVLFAGLSGLVIAQSVGSACGAGQVSGPDSLGNNLICSGGVFVAAGGYGGSTATDRISTSSVASGATLGMVVADKGTVSFTTGGVEGTSYLDTTGRWIGPGVSITTANGISSTNGYFSGNVGIGTNNPQRLLALYGSSNVYTHYTDSSTGTSVNDGFQTGIDASQNALLWNKESTSLRIATNNTERVTVLNTGNVGIGTTSPQATLQVSGSFTVSTSAQTTTPSLYVGTNGRVGLATSSPAQTLDVVGGAIIGQSSASNNSTFTTTGALTINTSGASNVLSVLNGTSGLNVNPNLGRLYMNAPGLTTGFSYDGGVTDGPTAVLLVVNSKNALSDAGAKLLAVRNANSEKLTLLGSGNLGIGTTAPSGTLWVSGTVGMTRYSAAPIACSSGYAGLMAMTSAYKLCTCDSSSWIDMVSGAACSW